jgi:hypothetical protein
MTEADKDKLIDEIVDITKQCCDNFNEGLADRLAEMLVDDLVKKFNISGVGVTLPSYDETNAEIVDGLGLIKTLKDSPFKNATTDEAYTTGFANCYNWLNEKLGN